MYYKNDYLKVYQLYLYLFHLYVGKCIKLMLCPVHLPVYKHANVFNT